MNEGFQGQAQAPRLAPGLYFVATPIGTARDITLRGLDILRDADAIAAEDTRTLRHLLEIHGIALNHRPLIAYHDHNGAAVRPRLMALLEQGKSVAYASEAGTPLVADPGYRLAQEAIAAGLPVTSAPGPSAVLAALTVSGLPSDRFTFAGFAPSTHSARMAWLEELAAVPSTMIFFESPRRVGEMLNDLCERFGSERPAAVCRELTKRFEEVRRGTLAELAASYAETPPKGEVVIVVGRPLPVVIGTDDIIAALRDRLGQMTRKDAAAEVAQMLNRPRREVYQIALTLD
ncbi:16S rRNA (cytidine(1402)-2'-O)-methyltransferase [Paracoccus sp. p4-l81]|uniref:16S rRNA (cytidine(1402)-2'-O)-methyltransferase n=1 Tax=Paracoccus sp. p4-l81 TaxID=3342806 RepID=UPI0035B931A2